jgi:hypothetical protein
MNKRKSKKDKMKSNSKILIKIIKHILSYLVKNKIFLNLN